MTQRPLDPARQEAFAGKAVGILNSASVALMMSLGHRTGLFEALRTMEPASSEAIASRAGLDERYVREWLGAMVTGGIMEHDHEAGTYFLPPEHAACLTGADSTDNVAPLMQIVPLMGNVEDEILECFRNGGGVPYASFTRFPEIMRELSRPRFNSLLVDTILPMAGVHEQLTAGARVLEVGCGSGHAANVMARAFPESTFLGYDLLEEQIETAAAEADAWGLGNVRFEARDVTTLEASESYDLVMAFDSVHDQARPDLLLQGIARALKPGGRFLMVDTSASSHLQKNRDHVLGPFLYSVSCMHCMTVSLAEGGMGLGAAWGEEKARAMLGDAGLAVESVQPLPDDPINSLFVSRKHG